MMTIKKLTEISENGSLSPSLKQLDADVVEISGQVGNALEVKEDGLFVRQNSGGGAAFELLDWDVKVTTNDTNSLKYFPGSDVDFNTNTLHTSMPKPDPLATELVDVVMDGGLFVEPVGVTGRIHLKFNDGFGINLDNLNTNIHELNCRITSEGYNVITPTLSYIDIHILDSVLTVIKFDSTTQETTPIVIGDYAQVNSGVIIKRENDRILLAPGFTTHSIDFESTADYFVTITSNKTNSESVSKLSLSGPSSNTLGGLLKEDFNSPADIVITSLPLFTYTSVVATNHNEALVPLGAYPGVQNFGIFMANIGGSYSVLVSNGFGLTPNTELTDLFSLPVTLTFTNTSVTMLGTTLTFGQSLNNLAISTYSPGATSGLSVGTDITDLTITAVPPSLPEDRFAGSIYKIINNAEFNGKTLQNDDVIQFITEDEFIFLKESSLHNTVDYLKANYERYRGKFTGTISVNNPKEGDFIFHKESTNKPYRVLHFNETIWKYTGITNADELEQGTTNKFYTKEGLRSDIEELLDPNTQSNLLPKLKRDLVDTYPTVTHITIPGSSCSAGNINNTLAFFNMSESARDSDLTVEANYNDVIAITNATNGNKYLSYRINDWFNSGDDFEFEVTMSRPSNGGSIPEETFADCFIALDNKYGSVVTLKGIKSLSTSLVNYSDLIEIPSGVIVKLGSNVYTRDMDKNLVKIGNVGLGTNLEPISSISIMHIGVGINSKCFIKKIRFTSFKNTLIIPNYD